MINVTFTEAQANMVRQALRAESDRMVRQGYAGLAKVVNEARDVMSDAMIDKNLSAVQNYLIANRNESGCRDIPTDWNGNERS